MAGLMRGIAGSETSAGTGAPLGRRRPTGEAPPLPRHVSRNTRLYVLLMLAVVVLWVALRTPSGVRGLTAADVVVLEAIAQVRSPILDDVMRGLHALGSEWVVRLIGWPTLVALLVLRRFQRLVILLGVTIVVLAVDTGMAGVIGRMRPPDPAASWVGYAHPSLPVALLGLTLVGAVYTLAPSGVWRNRLAVAAGCIMTLLALARLYLAVDHPTDVLAGAITGMFFPAVAFRLLAPDEVMPVSYRRRRRAHLDVGGRRGEAIATALRQQLGVTVRHVEPFALGGSAGSTPVRMTVGLPDGQTRTLFGKLYANVHLRSDRWYKLTRAVMYGRLEDERSFNTVRRLVEYEDHMLRVARDAGLPTAEPLGFVEITPEREYLLVTEFLDDAVVLSDEVLDDGVIDDALTIVRRMWNTGLAHRDIKPSNLLVQAGRVRLIDLAFAAIRPSPWRQAVDLANMMMTLALYSTPERVYERALRVFRPDDIAEAFAASRGATIPTQLRALVKKDGRQVDQKLRALAPPRAPIAIQRWTVRRMGLTVGVLVSFVVALALFFDYLQAAGLL